MSVLGVVEDFKNRKGSGKISLQPQKFVRTYTRRFIVRTSTVLDGPITVLTATGLPHRFDYYVCGNDYDFAAFCVEGTATPRSDSPTIWDAVFEYTTDIPAPDKSDPNNNPENDPTKRGTRYGMYYTVIGRVFDSDQLNFDQNNNGLPVVNSAGEKFDPPLEREVYLAVLTARRNESRLFVDVAHGNFSGFVNGNDFKINGVTVNKGTALAKIRQTQIFESALNGAGQQASYFDTDYEFTINPDLWAVAPLDQGTRKLVAGPSGNIYSDNKPVTITDAYGQPLNHPVNLDGSGRQNPPGAAPVFLNGKHGQFDHGPFNPFPQTQFPPNF